jgi:hypothetical protein
MCGEQVEARYVDGTLRRGRVAVRILHERRGRRLRIRRRSESYRRGVQSGTRYEEVEVRRESKEAGDRGRVGGRLHFDRRRALAWPLVGVCCPDLEWVDQRQGG